MHVTSRVTDSKEDKAHSISCYATYQLLGRSEIDSNPFVRYVPA